MPCSMRSGRQLPIYRIIPFLKARDDLIAVQQLPSYKHATDVNPALKLLRYGY